MLGRKRRQVVPIECVARGYLAGSGWKEYQATGTVCGIALPRGLRQCDRLPELIFTPASKAEYGHDENISFVRAVELVGFETMTDLRRLTLDLYARASTFAATRGILIADTKFENRASTSSTASLTLIDEILTPDSSRVWPDDQLRAGPGAGELRQAFTSATGSPRNPGTANATRRRMPADVVAGTRRRYVEAYETITGAAWA